MSLKFLSIKIISVFYSGMNISLVHAVGVIFILFLLIRYFRNLGKYV